MPTIHDLKPSRSGAGPASTELPSLRLVERRDDLSSGERRSRHRRQGVRRTWL